MKMLRLSQYLSCCGARLAVLFSLTVLAAMFPAVVDCNTLPPVCFVHVGPQDKPMPEFCLATNPGHGGNGSTVVIVTVVAFQKVRALLSQALPPAPEGVTGVYRVSNMSGNMSEIPRLLLEIGPDTMQVILDIVQSDFHVRKLPSPDVIGQLQRRLGRG